MGRAASFLVGMLTGAAAVLVIQKLIDANEETLDELQDTIEKQLNFLETKANSAAS